MHHCIRNNLILEVHVSAAFNTDYLYENGLLEDFTQHILLQPIHGSMGLEGRLDVVFQTILSPDCGFEWKILPPMKLTDKFYYGSFITAMNDGCPMKDDSIIQK